MTAEQVWVGVDVGGTKVLAGVVDGSGRVTGTARRSTPGRRIDAAMVEDALTEAVREVTGDAELAAVGVAAAGFVDAAGERSGSHRTCPGSTSPSGPASRTAGVSPSSW